MQRIAALIGFLANPPRAAELELAQNHLDKLARICIRSIPRQLLSGAGVRDS